MFRRTIITAVAFNGTPQDNLPLDELMANTRYERKISR